jgi:hypothetical protein
VVVSLRRAVRLRLSDDFDAVRDADLLLRAAGAVAVAGVARERARAPGAASRFEGARLSSSSMTLQSTSTLARG